MENALINFMFTMMIVVGALLHELPIKTFTGEFECVAKTSGLAIALLGVAMYARHSK